MAVAFSSFSPSVLISNLNSKIPFSLRNKPCRSILPSLNVTSKLHEMKRRRSANYHPTIWDPKVIESLNTAYTYDVHGSDLEELKAEVRSLLKASTKAEPRLQLEFIDSIQRLGVAYNFQDEIHEILNSIQLSPRDSNLYTTSLHFRLLRQHAFSLTSDVFNKFRDGNGKFKEDLKEDVVGLLSLYDASYLGINGEDVLEEAKNFSTKHLTSLLGKLKKGENIVAHQVEQALDIPLYWRMQRLEARNYINIYQMHNNKNLALLELAKLDFNLVQSVYQRELKELARWWTELGFKEKLQFSRDRLMENYLWAVGMINEPQFSKCRKGLTKFVCILSAIDDMYDIYGSLEELQLFTDAVNRWDTMALEELPEYMRICYLAMINFANELAYDVLKEGGLNVLPYIKEEWRKLCRSYLVEAKWYGSGYTPTFKEYIENAWISVGGHQAIVHSSSLLGHPLSSDSLNCLNDARDIIYWPCLIARLNDDLGTFEVEMKRGDVTKSIQCYMIEEGVTQEEAKYHIKGMIREAWKKLNEETANHSIPKSVVNLSLNMARSAQFIFQHGDGIGTSIGVTNDRLKSLIVEPILV